MSALENYLGFEHNGCDEDCRASIGDSCTCGREKAIAEYLALRTRIAELTTWQPIHLMPTMPQGDYLGLEDNVFIKMYWNYERDGWVDCYSEKFVNPTHFMQPKLPELP